MNSNDTNTYEIGDVVWAKMKGSRPWPAELIELDEQLHKVSRPKRSNKKTFVQFFGELRKVGFVNEENVWKYKEYRMRYGNPDKPTSGFRKAVLDADTCYYQRGGIKFDMDEPMEQVSDDDRKVLSNSSNTLSEVTEFELNPYDRKKRRISSNNSEDIKGGIQENPDNKRSKSLEAVFDFKDDTQVQLDVLNIKKSPKKLSSTQPSDVESRDMNQSSNTKDRKSSILKLERTDLKLGVLGLGTIGSAVVEVLAKAGSHITVWNRTTSKCQAMQKKFPQLTIGSTPADVVKCSDIIFSCLSDPYAVKHVVFGKSGVLESMDCGKGYVEMSILGPETVEDCERVIKHANCSFLEVQILGTRQQILSNEVELIASGDKELYERCGGYWAILSRSSQFLGETCYATYIMLCIAMLRANLTSAVAESLTFAERTGVSADMLANVMRASQDSLLNPSKMVREMLSKKPLSDGVALQHVQKDLRVVIDVADYLDLPLPVTAASNEVYKRAKNLGYKAEDRSSLIHTVRKTTSSTRRPKH